MTPREIGNSDFHPALGGALADDLPNLVRKTFREAVGDAGFQNDVDDTLGFVVLDRIVVAEGDTLADTSLKQPVDVGDDDLFELTGLD